MLRLHAIALLAFAAAGVSGDLGDRLLRTFPWYFGMPITRSKAEKQSWEANGVSCVEGLGMPYMMQGVNGSTTLFFTPAGQVSGIAIDVFGGAPSEEVVKQGFYVEVAPSHHRMSVAFRDTASVCSMTEEVASPIGDRLVVNPNGINLTLPLTKTEASSQGYFEGSCSVTMGHHYMKNLAAGSSAAETLMPIVPMYDNDGIIHGIRFHAYHSQKENIFASNNWDTLDISMCQNTCDDACTEDHASWSTLHLMFREPWKKTFCSWTCFLTCC